MSEQGQNTVPDTVPAWRKHYDRQKAKNALVPAYRCSIIDRPPCRGCRYGQPALDKNFGIKGCPAQKQQALSVRPPQSPSDRK